MKRAKARELTGERVDQLWNEAFTLVQKGDYSGARLVIEQSLVSEAKALEKSIQKHIDATAHANGNAFRMAIKDVEDRWLADYCEASIPTIRRWKEGSSLPTKAVQEAVIRALCQPAP